jgi:hypothetical protein
MECYETEILSFHIVVVFFFCRSVVDVDRVRQANFLFNMNIPI